QALFTHRDVPGVWPMVKHYFFFGPKPEQREAYNPLQKHAYTTVIILGVLSVLTGFAVWKPVQCSWLAWMMGGFHWARLWHFLTMWAILAFVFGHLVMVALHGWINFVSMLTGWKKDPDSGLCGRGEMAQPNVVLNNPGAETTREQGLIARVQRGQNELFYELVRPYERRVYAAALAILRNEADAEDVAQEAMLKAFANIRQFRA